MQSLIQIGHGMMFTLEAIFQLPTAFKVPQELLRQTHKTLMGALPLAIIAGLAIGVVVWIHLRDALVNVAGPSAMAYLPQALALAVVVEFAPLCSALILAGRSGASLAAEIGSMKQTEQIDALTLLGIRPMQALMAPRILACIISLPILTVFTAYLAIYSGFLTESLTGSMSFSQYQSEVLRVLTLRESLPALGKTVFFGLAIGISGCYYGMETEGGTEGVGKAATQGVVSSIISVLILNVFLVKTIQFFFN
ncbi:MAG: ABC transporter permease [Gemmataceae bacterium]|nr:ABC transporter permease [Gemmataceae bacterium]MBJ7343980.1 ABC transporter permease [Gemmataceae bacterium]